VTAFKGVRGFFTKRTRLVVILCLFSLGSCFVSDRLPVANATQSQEDGHAHSTFEVAGVMIEVTFAPGDLDLPRAKVLDWITTSAQAVAYYYGRFPVSDLRVQLTPMRGKGVRFGTTFGGRRPLIEISLGQSATEVDLQKDWVMTHEMVHLAFPYVPRTHHWIEEGLATYVEPLARLGIGQLSAEEVWRELVDGLPQGLPKAGDEGLDHTPTWGRTYWGGALFCLLADIEIRQRTANQHGLQDALRAIVTAGGSMQTSWSLRRALEVGDQATGVPVLMELYDRMKATPVEIDLAELWQRLGVEVRGESVIFDDDAPLASVRRTITNQ